MNWFTITLIAIGVCCVAAGGEPGFTAKPTAVRVGDKVKIRFTISAPTDVEIAILNANGEVVRHLVAGVLGVKNPPPEPLKAGLAQELVWDGLDDTGKPMEGGHFKVRIRAGLGVKFDGFIGEDRHFVAFPRGLATDQAGNLYLYSTTTGNRGPNGSPYLQVFDRGGKYLRTLMPMPADLPIEKARPLGVIENADGSFCPANFLGTWPVFYQGLDKPHVFASTVPETGTIHVMTSTTIGRIGPDGGAIAGWFSRNFWAKGSEPSQGVINWHMAGPGGISLSADGKAAYVTGLFQHSGAGMERFPPSRVYRMEMENGSLEKFADVRDGQGLAGSALDRDGNLLVCDPGAGRVVVLSPKGEEIGAINLPSAAAVACHRKTGAVYVLAYRGTSEYVTPKTLVKFSGWKETREEGRIELRREGGMAALALDDSASPAVVWLATSCTKGGFPYHPGQPAQIFRFEEQGGKFTKSQHEIKFPITPAGMPTRLAVHPQDDKIICRGEYTAAAGYEGLTGKPLVLPFKACLDMAVGLDGNWYLQAIPDWKGSISRFDRDLKPLANAGGSNVAGFAYGRAGAGLGCQGIAADARGRVYSMTQVNEQTSSGVCVVVYGPDGKPEDHGRLKGNALITGHHKQFESAIVSGLGAGGNIAVDWKGNMYIGVRGYPSDWKPPAGFEKDEMHWVCTGSVVKFKPEGGQVMGLGGPESRPFSPPVPIPEGKQGLRLGIRNCYGSGPLFAENAVKAYPGMSCNGPFNSVCTCRQPMFQLDGWGRLFIPSALDCSVKVVDNEGNPILTFGAYGNSDSRSAGADSPIKKPEVPLGWPEAVGASDKAVYVADVLNRRIVRLLKTFAAEELCEAK